LADADCFVSILCEIALEKAQLKFLVIGFPALAVCLLAEALLQWRYLGTDNKVGNAFAVFFIFVFIVFYQVGLINDVDAGKY
jgi:hypothetical protein